MGEALARGIVRAQVVAPADLYLFDVRTEVATQVAGELGGRARSSLSEAAEAEVLVLAVKPQVMPALLAELGPCVGGGAVVLSVAAGVSLATLEAALPDTAEVVRCMPNTPALVGLGASAYALGSVQSGRGRGAADAILGAVGIALEVPEAAMDAVTALSGSGPAYVFRMLEAMIAAGEAMDLAPEVADALARRTLLGAATLADGDVDARELRRRVTSPGGTTAAALEVLEARRWGHTLERAIDRARARSEELGRGGDEALRGSALDRARAAHDRHRHPVAVLDLDLTLIENTPRTRRVIADWLESLSELDTRPAATALSSIPLVYSIRDNLSKVIDVIDPLDPGDRDELLRSGLSFWRRAFFDSAYLVQDVALDGAVGAVRQLVGAGCTVVYLTARPLAMAAGTVASLRTLGFPIGEPHAILATKPTSYHEEDDRAFKARALEWCARLGTVVLLAENEPSHANHMHQAFPDALTVLVGDRHRPNAPEPLPGVRRVARLSDAL